MGETVRVAGHLQDYRALGGVAFALLRDRSGLVQVTLKKGVTPPALFELLEGVPRESVLRVDGTVAANPRARVGAEVLPDRIEVLSRAEVPLPLGVVDKVHADLDTRFNHRVLDLRKPEVQALVGLRAALLDGFRETFRELGFVEVETPKILRQGAEGGATMFPVDYFGTRAYLAQSPQLYKQMLMATDLEQVFEIGPAFRAEPSDTQRHLTEFTSIDAEMAYLEGPEDLWRMVERLVSGSLNAARRRLEEEGSPLAGSVPEPSPPFPRVPFSQAAELLGRVPGSDSFETDFQTEDEKRLGEILPARFGNDFYFLTEFPTAIKRGTFYAMRQDDHPDRTNYFDLDFRGQEMLSGGQREHRLPILEAQIREAGLSPESFGAYLEAFRYGMPPHGGFALGLDRLAARIAGIANIREVRLFPRDRYRLEP